MLSSEVREGGVCEGGVVQFVAKCAPNLRRLLFCFLITRMGVQNNRRLLQIKKSVRISRATFRASSPHRLAFSAIGPSRITQLIPQEFSGVTEVKFITPIHSLRIFWCKRSCNFLIETRQGGVISLENYAYKIPRIYLV